MIILPTSSNDLEILRVFLWADPGFRTITSLSIIPVCLLNGSLSCVCPHIIILIYIKI